MRGSLALLLAAACGPADVTPTAAAATEPPPAPVASKPAPIAKGVPHGSTISEVAATEEGDAAISFDALRGIRLWPTLDGTRPPVPISADAPHELALAHAGQDLLAAILDDAGGVRVLRLGLDGAVHGRATLPGEYEQVIALDVGVIVRTKDHAIEWYAADGTAKGRVMADPAQRVHTIVARRGRVVALVGKAQSGIGQNMRYLTLGTTLSWGDTLELPIGVKDELFALSPSGKRVGLVDMAEEVHVFDIANIKPTEIHGTPLRTAQAVSFGFISDDDLAVATASSTINVWHPAPPPNDPWSVQGSPTTIPMPRFSHFIDGTTFVDGLVVSGYGTSLVLSTTSAVKYLGWKTIGAGNLLPAGSQFAMTMTGTHYVWFDDKLHASHDVELRPGDTGPWITGYPVDEQHMVTQTPVNGKFLVELSDLGTNKRTRLGEYTGVDRIEYSPETHLLGIAVGRKIERFRVDLDANTATPEAPLRVRGGLTSLRLLDPAKADGVIAVTVGWDNDWDNENTLTIYREGAKPKKVKSFGGQVLTVDPTGTMYLLVHDAQSEIRVQKGTKVLSKFALPELTAPVAVADDGSRIAYVAKGEIVMLDRAGKQLWREHVWGASQLVFTHDTGKLVVRANGGIVVLDGTTGVRTATECGWDFGLYTDALPVSPANTSPVCEDPTLQ